MMDEEDVVAQTKHKRQTQTQTPKMYKINKIPKSFFYKYK